MVAEISRLHRLIGEDNAVGCKVQHMAIDVPLFIVELRIEDISAVADDRPFTRTFTSTCVHKVDGRAGTLASIARSLQEKTSLHYTVVVVILGGVEDETEIAALFNGELMAHGLS